MKRMMLLLFLAVFLLCGLAGCTEEIAPTAVPLPSATAVPPTVVPATAIPPTGTTPPTDIPEPTATLDPTVFEIRSPAFGNGEPIPVRYTCNDRDVSPPLEWGDPPEGTVSLALFSEDLTVGGFVHWIFFNIPPETRSLPEAVPLDGHFPDGSQQGTNNRLLLGYMGPCPPPRTHEYSFTLYALDTMLDLDDGVMRIEFKEAMQGHILAETEIVGLYYP